MKQMVERIASESKDGIASVNDLHRHVETAESNSRYL